MPVGNVQRTIFAYDRIGGTEISIGTIQQFLYRRPPDMSVFTLGPITSIEIVLFDTEETDDIEDQKILLQSSGKWPEDKISFAGTGRNS